MRILVLACLLTGCFLCLGCPKKQPASPAPLLSLKTYSGETYTVSPQDSQVTLIVFWATWCQPCLMEIPILVKLQEKYRARGFRVVGVNVDDPDGSKARPILTSFGINYPVVISTDDIVNKFGGIDGIPTSFLIGRDGSVKERLEGLAPEDMLEGKIVAQLGTAH